MSHSTCVKCAAPMTPVQPRPNIQIYMCRACKGIWFPKGMLARQLNTKQDLPGAVTAVRPTKYSCGTCRTPMVELPFAGNSSLLVDSCQTCGGVFLDANE